MTESDGEVKMTLPVFKGKKFPEWSRKFKAYARTKKFAPALMSNFDLPESADLENTLDDTKAEDQKKLKRVIMNQNATAALTIALRGSAAARCLQRSETSKWPDGIAHQAMTNLQKKYVLTSIVNQTAL